MPIQFNPFRPVCDNLLIPLAYSLAEPYTELARKSILPLYYSVTKPCRSYDQAVKRSEALLKTVELAVQFFVYFLVYQKGCSLGMHYFGLAGGGAAFALIYGAGYWVDRQLNTCMNDICTGSWLYCKGITTLLTSFGKKREGMLAALVVGRYLTYQNPTYNSWDGKRLEAAKWLAKFVFQKPSIPDSSRDNLVNSTQDSPNGESI